MSIIEDHTSSQNQHRAIGLWLLATAAMVFAMAVIGAITRLTESGLSMVEWRPLIGTMPPLTAEEWLRVFALYQQTPEYQQINKGMSLEAFKYIFFWEWFHRFWGRMIGLVYALPLIYFWVRGLIPQGYHLKLTLMLLLGGSQAVMGWYMVESGLVDEPAVSHYRLAAHLGLAFIIFALLIKLSMNFIRFPQWLFPKNKAALQRREVKNLRLWATIALVITMVWGAFTAGLDAGKIYNSYPLMGGSFFPTDAGALSPFILNFFESHAGVQFAHRWIALTALILVSILAMRTRHYALKGMIILQFILGIATLLSHVQIGLASLHQAGALILIGLLVINASAQKYKNL